MNDQPEPFDLTSHNLPADKQQELLRLFPEIRTEGGLLPADLASDWISPSGQYRVEAFPKGDGNDREVMTAFARQAQANLYPR